MWHHHTLQSTYNQFSKSLHGLPRVKGFIAAYIGCNTRLNNLHPRRISNFYIYTENVLLLKLIIFSFVPACQNEREPNWSFTAEFYCLILELEKDVVVVVISSWFLKALSQHLFTKQDVFNLNPSMPVAQKSKLRKILDKCLLSYEDSSIVQYHFQTVFYT